MSRQSIPNHVTADYFIDPILTILRTNGPTQRSEFHRMLQRDGITAPLLTLVLDELATEGLITSSREASGGRTATVWALKDTSR